MNAPSLITISGVAVPAWMVATTAGVVGFIIVTTLAIIGWFVRNAYRDIKEQIADLLRELKSLTAEINRDFVRQGSLIENGKDHSRIWHAIEELRGGHGDLVAQMNKLQGEHDATVDECGRRGQ